MIINQEINREMLEKFKIETTLNDELTIYIYRSLKDSLEFQKFCIEHGDNTQIIMLQEICVDIYKDEYNCIYTKYSDMLSIYSRFDGVFAYPWYDNADEITINDEYKSNRRVPVFVRNVINEMIKFDLIIV